MATHDQMFRTASPYDTLGKYPYIYFADTEMSILASYGYINNSLEGAEFDADSGGTGQITMPGLGTMTPNFSYMDSSMATSYSIDTLIISSGICTVTLVSSIENIYEVGDMVSINGVDFDVTHPYINGTWKIYSIDSSDYKSFTFEVNAPDAGYYGSLASSGFVTKGFAFKVADYRPTTDAKGKSFTSLLFTLKNVYSDASSIKRVLPSDLYTRFRLQTGSDISPQGGINSNLFNVFTSDGLTNIKPVLWAYFFGYNDPTIISRTTATIFEVVFNSYAVVLRPSGTGSNLEFAIVKFNWGTDAGSTWSSSIVGQSWFNKYTISGTDLGYLISTNPSVGTNKVSEIAKSDSFAYNSEFPVKLNLKISIRKHLLSDSQLDSTYLVNLMVNDDYDVFGDSAHYDSILHAYISKPGLDLTATGPFNVTNGTQPHDSMLMPIMYFKFNNINESNVNAPGFDLSIPGSSKIVQDSLFFRQINSAAVNSAGTSYLY